MNKNDLQSVRARNEAFTRWAKKQGLFLHPDVSFLTPTKTMGMGVFARRGLPEKTVVASCPMAVALSPYAEPSALTPSVAILRSDPHVMADAVVHVVLRLMAERCRASSPWRAWLEVCPRMENHLFALTARQSALLGCATQHTGGLRGGDAESDHEGGDVSMSWTHVSQQCNELCVAQRWTIAQRLMSSHREVWPPKQATYALFCECLAHVYSRNFHREEVREREGPYLLPGLDMLNHSRTPNALLQVRGGTRKNDLCFTVVTTRALRAGDQVYISYGHIGVARFVVEFQFATPSVLAEDMIRFSVDTLISLVLTMQGHGSGTSPLATRSLRETMGGATEQTADDDNDIDTSVRRASTRESALAEAARRVEYLQRMGMLYDEGLYLHNMPLSLQRCIAQKCMPYQPRPHATVADYLAELGNNHVGITAVKEEEAELLDSRTRAQRATEALSSLQTLANVMYLMMVDRATFDTAYHTIIRDWVCVWSVEVVDWVHAALRLRHQAAVQQEGAIDAAFGVSTETDRAAASLESGGNQGDASAADDESTGAGGASACDKEHAANVARSRLLHTALQSEVSVLEQHLNLLSHVRKWCSR